MYVSNEELIEKLARLNGRYQCIEREMLSQDVKINLLRHQSDLRCMFQEYSVLQNLYLLGIENDIEKIACRRDHDNQVSLYHEFQSKLERYMHERSKHTRSHSIVSSRHISRRFENVYSNKLHDSVNVKRREAVIQKKMSHLKLAHQIKREVLEDEKVMVERKTSRLRLKQDLELACVEASIWKSSGDVHKLHSCSQKNTEEIDVCKSAALRQSNTIVETTVSSAFEGLAVKSFANTVQVFGNGTSNDECDVKGQDVESRSNSEAEILNSIEVDVILDSVNASHPVGNCINMNTCLEELGVLKGNYDNGENYDTESSQTAMVTFDSARHCKFPDMEKALKCNPEKVLHVNRVDNHIPEHTLLFEQLGCPRNEKFEGETLSPSKHDETSLLQQSSSCDPTGNGPVAKSPVQFGHKEVTGEQVAFEKRYSLDANIEKLIAQVSTDCCVLVSKTEACSHSITGDVRIHNMSAKFEPQLLKDPQGFSDNSTFADEVPYKMACLQELVRFGCMDKSMLELAAIWIGVDILSLSFFDKKVQAEKALEILKKKECLGNASLGCGSSSDVSHSRKVEPFSMEFLFVVCTWLIVKPVSKWLFENVT